MNHINYKDEDTPNDLNSQILLKKDPSPDEIEDYDLYVLIDSSIKQIENNHSIGQIDDQFFQEIIDLTKAIKKNKSQFAPILINSKIINILFTIYEDEKLNKFKLPVLFCLNNISDLDFSVNNALLQENFINLFKTHFSFENDEFNSYLIYTYYNILQSIYDQRVIDQILEILPIREFFSLAHKIENEQDIIIYTFLCLSQLMKYKISNADDENVIYEIISYYFYDRELYKDESVMIQNTFSKNSLAIIKNRLYYDSLNFELFEKYKLYELIEFYLKNPPIQNFSIACDIISSLIIKHQCKYPFDIEVIIRNFTLFNSERNQFSAINSMDCLIQMNPSLSQFFFKERCSLFFLCVDSFIDFNSKTKEILFQLISNLLKNAISENWICIFNGFCNENHESLFSIISQILDYGEYQSQSIDVLEMIFKWGLELGFKELCYTQFAESFENDYKEKFNIIDEKTLSFFNTYFKNDE